MLLYGAIISATDPVAVVALLKELGVSKDISTLIEGESLLNDGTALVLFLVLDQYASGIEKPILDAIGQFFYMSFLGPLVGLIFGLILIKILSRIHNKPILEANLTVCFPYLTFYLCELEMIHVSGILALVAMGLVMTNRGRDQISVESQEAMHEIWSYITFCAETSIFLLTGVILGSGFVEDGISWLMLGQLIGLYVFLHIIRFVGLVVFLPCMKLTGYPINIKHSVLLAFSGLRGAVGLSLALQVR